MRWPKIRFYFRLSQVFWKKHRRLIIFSLATTLLVIFFLPKLMKTGFGGNQKKIGLVGRYSLSNLPYEITSLISYGLTIPLPDGSVEPGLAQSWETEDNGQSYLFTLKEGEKWHDGSTVIAKDINYNFSDVKTETLDNQKLKFELKEPFSPFPSVVSRPIFKKNLIGFGDYRVKLIEESGQIIRKLVLNPLDDQTKPTLIFHFYPNEEAAKTGFKLGEVDYLEDIIAPGELEGWARTKIETNVKYNRYTALFFNTQLSQFADKPVRQALAYALEKKWSPRALSSFSPDSWFYNSTVKPYHYDLENAKSLLGQGEGGKTIEKITLSTISSLLNIAEEIKKDWEKLGIEVVIQIIQSPDEEFEVLLVSQQIPRDPDQYALWHSTQASNLSHYKSPKLDKLLEDGRKTFEQEKRKEIYLDFQRFLVEDSPAIFLFYPTVYNISRK
ncbi:MAG: ABC transporter substrate-binding protein [Candidatus Marinimicrobia bacterium]|nr:ABC transporter substrate-binding protein [Candidatus Neomarinimicrobiota bacterium]